MDWLGLILILSLTIYVFFAWKRKQEKFYFWLFCLGILSLIVLIWNYLANYVFNFSESLKENNNIIVHYFWLLFLVLLGIIVFRYLLIKKRK